MLDVGVVCVCVCCVGVVYDGGCGEKTSVACKSAFFNILDLVWYSF